MTANEKAPAIRLGASLLELKLSGFNHQRCAVAPDDGQAHDERLTIRWAVLWAEVAGQHGPVSLEPRLLQLAVQVEQPGEFSHDLAVPR